MCADFSAECFRRLSADFWNFLSGTVTFSLAVLVSQHVLSSGSVGFHGAHLGHGGSAYILCGLMTGGWKTIVLCVCGGFRWGHSSPCDSICVEGDFRCNFFRFFSMEVSLDYRSSATFLENIAAELLQVAGLRCVWGVIPGSVVSDPGQVLVTVGTERPWACCSRKLDLGAAFHRVQLEGFGSVSLSAGHI